MDKQNHYCCKCHKTTAWTVRSVEYVCTECGTVVIRSPQLPPKTPDFSLLSESRILFHD